MFKNCIFLFCAVFCFSCIKQSQLDQKDRFKQPDNTQFSSVDSVNKYLNSAIDTIQQHSINRNKLNWKLIRDKAHQDAKGAKSYEKTYFAIDNVIKQLKDQHSFFKTPNDYKSWLKRPISQVKPRFPLGRIDDDFAIIPITTFASGDSTLQKEYALHLISEISQLNKKKPKAWIIDLRYNRGGNLWPMLAGISPLLQKDTPLGYFVTEENRNAWSYRNNKILLNENIIFNVPEFKNIEIADDTPVAILIGENTSTSAEALIVSLLGKKQVRLFGVPTAGLTTANSQHTLADSAQLIVSSARLSNRNGEVYKGKIIPHVNLNQKWYYFKLFEFMILKSEVEKWLTEFE